MKRGFMPNVSCITPPLHFSLMFSIPLFKTCHVPHSNLVSSCHLQIVNHCCNNFHLCLGSFGFIQNFKLNQLRKKEKLIHAGPGKQILVPKFFCSFYLILAFLSKGVLVKYPLTFGSKMATENHELLSSELKSLKENRPFYLLSIPIYAWPVIPVEPIN